MKFNFDLLPLKPSWIEFFFGLTKMNFSVVFPFFLYVYLILITHSSWGCSVSRDITISPRPYAPHSPNFIVPCWRLKWIIHIYYMCRKKTLKLILWFLCRCTNVFAALLFIFFSSSANQVDDLWSRFTFLHPRYCLLINSYILLIYTYIHILFPSRTDTQVFGWSSSGLPKACNIGGSLIFKDKGLN